MIVQALAFWMFALVAVASGAMVITARNPVHSVLFLILAFFNAAGLFVLLGAEFLAMILVVVYVGAVAVLFLFVVMMLDINFVELRQGFQRYLPIGGLIGLVLLCELFLVLVAGWSAAPAVATAASAPTPSQVTNTAALGQLLYTRYVYAF
ncbi:MAG: NADH-quinone oxidoreductase subunit J, partial [Acidobacteriota bacterium]